MFLIFDAKVVVSKGLSALLPVVLLGCSSMPLGVGDALAQSPDVPQTQSEMDSQLMFELMIAELAGRRGQLDVALAGYLRASQGTDDPRVSERATRLAMYGRQWSDAEAMARRWISLDAENSEARQMLGQALLRQDKTDLAAEIYTDLISETDERRQLLRDIQVELQRNDNPAASVSIMQSLASEFTGESEAHLGLARAFLINNESASALKATEMALEVAPGDTDALLLHAQILGGTGKPEEAFSTLRAALDTAPDNTELRLGYAQLLVESGRYDEVGAELALIDESSEPDADTLLTISLLALESKRIEQARSFLTQLRDSGDYPDEANFYLARISDEQQDYEQAISFYDRVGQGELLFTAQVRAAELTALTGDLEQGQARLHQLASVVPDPTLQPRLVTTESRMLQNAKKAAEAVEVLNKGLQRFPDDNDLLYARALASVAVGDEQTMISDLSRLIELDSENAHALNALGYHYADENIELELAEQMLTKANKLLPDDPAVLDSLGWLRYRQGNYTDAIELLGSAYKKYPDPEIAAHLAEALWLNGARGEARELIEEALKIDPEDEKLLAVQKNVFK